MKTTAQYFGLLAITLCAPWPARADILINEFMHDDAGTDDREFVELYNTGLVPVSIAGWTISGRDPAGLNLSTTLPAGATIPAGGYYVVGNTGTLNVSHVVAAGFLENDNETIELRDTVAALVDAVAYETNKGVVFAAPVSAQVGGGVFSNLGNLDTGVSPSLNTTVSFGRFADGRDTNVNGRDFGMRPSTPGTTNAPGGTMTSFILPDPSGATTGSALASMTGSFVSPRVIDPGVIDANNPNAISAPAAATKAYVAWDPSGGGNGATTNAVFDTKQSAFSIQAYFDTRDLPVQSNATGTPFRGSEVTVYGIGSADPLNNLTDISGAVGLGAVALPASESANGVTGIAWVYEKVGVDVGGSAVSEMLYLVDAQDGGDSDTGGNTPLKWSVLASYDLSTETSDWFDLSIAIDSLGNGVAVFDGNVTNFTTADLNSGAFSVSYRENLQIGADGTPDALLRPATFSVIPEPSSGLMAAGFAAGVMLRRRRKAQP